MGFQLAESGDGSGGDGGGGGSGGGGKRSRKSACPRRIQQSSCEAMDAQHQPPEESDAAAAASDAGAATSGGSPDMNSTGGDSDRRSSPPVLLPTHPSQPQTRPQAPAQLQLPSQRSAGLEEGPDLLRNLATLNPQSLIPSLYTWAGGGSFDSGFAVSGDPRRPRGRPKGPAHAGFGAPASPPSHASRSAGGAISGGLRGSGGSGGPRPFDPHAVLQPVRIITRKGVAYNRRPRSFYSAEVKLSVIEYAEQHGASAAERQFNIPLSTVQSWMRHENKARILQAPCDLQSVSAFAPAPARTPATAPAFSTAAAATDEQPLNLTASRIPLPSNVGNGAVGGGRGFLSPLSLLPLSHRPF